MDIRINVDGASTDEIERGLAAARAVFSKAGITPAQAADARFAVDGRYDGKITQERTDRQEVRHCGVQRHAE